MTNSAESQQDEPLLFLVDGEVNEEKHDPLLPRRLISIDPVLVRLIGAFGILCILFTIIIPFIINAITHRDRDAPDFTCARTQHNASQFFAFDDSGPESQFLLRENLVGRGLSGRIHVTSPYENQTVPILVEVRSRFDAPDALDFVNIHHAQGWQSSLAIELRTDNILMLLQRGCLTMDIFIHVQPTVELAKFEIETHSASVVIGEHASFSARQAYFSMFERKPSRTLANFAGGRVIFDKVAIYLGHGSITGSWIQSKEITMHVSMAGNISIDIKPHNFGEPFFDETQATLVLDGHDMGHVDVRMPLDSPHVVNRRYWTSIWVDAGDISGSFVHSLNTKLETRSGNINATLLPLDINAEDGWRSTIETHSEQGSTMVNVLDALSIQGSSSKILSRTSSNHTVSSLSRNPPGALWLKYPHSWAGWTDGHLADGTGSLKLGGLWAPRPPGEILIAGERYYRQRWAEDGSSDSSLHFAADRGTVYLEIAA